MVGSKIVSQGTSLPHRTITPYLSVSLRLYGTSSLEPFGDGGVPTLLYRFVFLNEVDPSSLLPATSTRGLLTPGHPIRTKTSRSSNRVTRIPMVIVFLLP